MARAEVELEERPGCVAQGQWQASVCAHPLVDGMRLAQRALRGRDAVGDAPVALAKTPQLAADLLRAEMPAQARLPSSSLRWTQAACSLPVVGPTLLSWVSRNLLGYSSRAWPATSPLPTYALHSVNTCVP